MKCPPQESAKLVKRTMSVIPVLKEPIVLCVSHLVDALTGQRLEVTASVKTEDLLFESLSREKNPPLQSETGS